MKPPFPKLGDQMGWIVNNRNATKILIKGFNYRIKFIRILFLFKTKQTNKHDTRLKHRKQPSESTHCRRRTNQQSNHVMSFKFFCKLTNSWCGRDVLEMRLLRLLGIAVLLESLKKLLQGLLRDFTPSSLQVSKFSESETRIQLMSGRIKRPPQRNTLRILHCQSTFSLGIKNGHIAVVLGQNLF